MGKYRKQPIVSDPFLRRYRTARSAARGRPIDHLVLHLPLSFRETGPSRIFNAQVRPAQYPLGDAVESATRVCPYIANMLDFTNFARQTYARSGLLAAVQANSGVGPARTLSLVHPCRHDS
jgi:hypothetical protein